MIKNLQTLAFATAVAFLSAIGSASGYVVNGNDSNVALNDGAFADGTETTPKNLFNQTLISMGDETVTSSPPIPMFDIPIFKIDDQYFLKFIYDQQETGVTGNTEVHIDALVLTVGGMNIWSLDQTIALNTGADEFTDTPLSPGGDMAIYIPVSLFNGLGKTGEDLLTLTATQSLSDNGGDEWALSDVGAAFYFDPGDEIHNPPGTSVPEPATLAIFGLGLAGLALSRRRKNKTVFPIHPPL